jgi:hypothetical protein
MNKREQMIINIYNAQLAKQAKKNKNIHTVKKKVINYKFVLICATGRSGSTTLQRIINTIPGANICGENGNAIVCLLQFYKNIKFINNNNNLHTYSYYVEKNLKPCWYNNFNMQETVRQIKNLILSFLNHDKDATIIGFKEIRYDKENFNLLQEFVELFPNTKIIVHIKNNIMTQSKSDWWAENENSYNILKQLNADHIDYYNASDKNNTYLSTFEEMFDLQKIKNIFIFLNEEMYFNENKIKAILDNNQR